MTRHPFLSLGAAAVVLMFGAATGAADQQDSDFIVMQRFRQSVQDYATLHRDVARTVPAVAISEDIGKVQYAIDALASAIRAARPAASTGDIFTADVADVFTSRIHRSLFDSGYDVAILLDEINEDCDPSAGVAVVNHRFPWARGSMMLPSILAVLPPLPVELQYRFLDTDLVLVDVNAGVVVDILPGVLAGE